MTVAFSSVSAVINFISLPSSLPCSAFSLLSPHFLLPPSPFSPCSLPFRHRCDYHLSNTRAFTTDIWCCHGATSIPPPHSWHHHGRGQPEGRGRQAAEGSEPPRGNTRKTAGPLASGWSMCHYDIISHTRGETTHLISVLNLSSKSLLQLTQVGGGIMSL